MTMLEKLILLQETEAANAERLKIWKGCTKYDVKCYDPCGRICLVIGYWKSLDALAKQPV